MSSFTFKSVHLRFAFVPKDPNVCSDGFTVIGDKCFWKSDDPATWRGAKDLCDGKDAKLFIAPTEDDQFDLLGKQNIC